MALGEQAPKSLAIRSAKTLALWTAPVLIAFYCLFFPLIWLLNKASLLTLWVLGLGKTDHDEVAHTEEELRHIVAESAGGGHLSRRERVMIENVLNLEEKTARRIMVPRPDVVYLSLARPVEDNLRTVRQAGHTRYPLCEDDLTTVIGIIHVKDLFRAAIGTNGRPDLRKIARKVPFLPETLHLDQLLLEFQRDRVHLAMLLDEFGSVVGMVTLENVLEELVGPIQDEFDREAPQVTDLGDGVFEVDAACPLDVLAESCGVAVPETEAETAGGLVLDILGRLGRPGDSVAVDGHRLTVIQADPTRIRRLRSRATGRGAGGFQGRRLTTKPCSGASAAPGLGSARDPSEPKTRRRPNPSVRLSFALVRLRAGNRRGPGLERGPDPIGEASSSSDDRAKLLQQPIDFRIRADRDPQAVFAPG